MNAEMRGDWRSAVLAGVVLAALASLAIADDAADKEAKRLEGTWKFLSLSVDGDEAPQEFIQKGRWSIRGKEITIPGPGGGKLSYKVDPSRSPKAIDMTGSDGPGRGKTLKGIYKIEEGRLTICLPGGKKESPDLDLARPEEFGGGQGKSLIVLERSKDE
jgi:uncharacterized protein (TIGR03067 family)